jgi:hypothetical protein
MQSQTKKLQNCRSQVISGSDWVDIWTVEIEAIYFSAPVVPTYNTRYSKTEGLKMKLYAVTILNMIGLGRCMEKDTNFSKKTDQKRNHMMAFFRHVNNNKQQ